MSLCLINMNPKLLLLRKNIWMVATLCIGVSSFSHAEVYKCENAGKISYQQSPCETKSKSTKMAMSSASPNLWTNLKSGLSVAEVQRMVPQAKNGDYSSLSNGARGLLQVSPVNFAGKKNWTAKPPRRGEAHDGPSQLRAKRSVLDIHKIRTGRA